MAPDSPQPGHPARVLLASVQDLSDPVGAPSRNSSLVVELDRRFDVVGSIVPELSRAESYLARLRYAYPNRTAWRGRAGLAPWTFKRMSVSAGRALASWNGRYDALLIFQTLFAPGRRHQRPFTIYTDNIHSLTWRFLPKWVPFSPRQRRARIALERRMCLDASRIFAMSEFVRRALIEDYECDPQRVVQVGAGSNNIAESLEGKRYDSRIALFVGINFKLKGGQVLLRAWSRVRERVPTAELWILGPPPPRGSGGDGVRWLGFIRDRDQVAKVYERAALFVLPSFYDAYPHALREAMGSGLPCIGTARGGVPENIDEGRTGLLVEPGEPEQLAEAIVTIIDDPDRARAMGQAGYEEILAEHTWVHVADRMSPHLSAVAAERGA